MKEKVYYYNGNIDKNSTIILKDEEFRHLAIVMRARVNDSLFLINGDGNFYQGIIKSIDKKSASIAIENIIKSNNEPNLNISLFQALAKGDKLSLITQKITELGATDLYLFESKFSDIKSNSHKPERLDSISISAAKQCGRATFVNIHNTLTISEIANMIKNFDKFYVAYENSDGLTLYDDLKESKDISNIAIMIGAEGGFDNSEIELLKQNGAIIVSLGSRILRTETASIATVSLISQMLKN